MHFSDLMKALRLAAVGALLSVAAVTEVAAQTVIVRNVTAGDQIEVFVNSTKAASGVADAAGIARMTIDKAAAIVADTDARVYVDVCGKLRRIHVVDRNRQPTAKEDACDRREITGIFLVRPRSTLVVDAGAVIPTMLLRQGRYDPTAGKIRVLAPKGLSVFGGGGIVQFDNPVRFSCGSVSDCDGDSAVLSFTGGADFWVTRWLGVEGAYVKPRKITTQGAGGFFKFTDTYDAHLVTVTGKLGLPVGRARLFGKGGGVFHSATTTSVVTIADVDQTLRLRTEGWSWVAGGGIEVWTGRKFALYAEATFGRIRGEAVGDNVEGEAFDNLMAGIAGFRVKIF
jgi:hypothetical protein